jgi:hypothetical protein
MRFSSQNVEIKCPSCKINLITFWRSKQNFASSAQFQSLLRRHDIEENDTQDNGIYPNSTKEWEVKNSVESHIKHTAECRSAVCCVQSNSVKCHSAWSHSAQCHSLECYSAVILLSGIKLSVILISGVKLSIMSQRHA